MMQCFGSHRCVGKIKTDERRKKDVWTIQNIFHLFSLFFWYTGVNKVNI